MKIQKKLDLYRNWYNTQRPMWVLDGWTPEQAFASPRFCERKPSAAEPIRARDPAPDLRVVKHDYGGDPQLPVLEISFDQERREAA